MIPASREHRKAVKFGVLSEVVENSIFSQVSRILKIFGVASDVRRNEMSIFRISIIFSIERRVVGKNLVSFSIFEFLTSIQWTLLGRLAKVTHRLF
jgi:hypothetical protein